MFLCSESTPRLSHTLVAACAAAAPLVVSTWAAAVPVACTVAAVVNKTLDTDAQRVQECVQAIGTCVCDV